ncbi:MAG: phosphoribosylformylglycinamidine synthase subunit PurQ [Chloroflexota bacterium]|nr:phosphoribosylformylglycinamidine synthase subunit PurQ [Chloroflexota bacterium]MXX67276.1 phosphoribosylformylglycinamidine synthase subunit PurQ [Chloroflexota bacterium]
MKAAVLVFPGSNCDRDAQRALLESSDFAADLVPHGRRDLGGYDLIVLPGGFAHGDYLRCGAIARFSPCLEGVAAAAGRGVPVLGICNGFQILLEAGLLPGAMLPNESSRFEHGWIRVRCEAADTAFTAAAAEGNVLRLLIAHGEGNYHAPPDQLARIESAGQVVFRYCDGRGRLGRAHNPNGSVNHIAGVCNQARNVVGLMPHPERASSARLGSTDGTAFWDSAARWLMDRLS